MALISALPASVSRVIGMMGTTKFVSDFCGLVDATAQAVQRFATSNPLSHTATVASETRRGLGVFYVATSFKTFCDSAAARVPNYVTLVQHGSDLAAAALCGGKALDLVGTYAQPVAALRLTANAIDGGRGVKKLWTEEYNSANNNSDAVAAEKTFTQWKVAKCVSTIITSLGVLLASVRNVFATEAAKTALLAVSLFGAISGVVAGYVEQTGKDVYGADFRTKPVIV